MKFSAFWNRIIIAKVCKIWLNFRGNMRAHWCI